MCAQVLGELVRDGGHYGFDGGKLGGCQEKGVRDRPHSPEGSQSPLSLPPGQVRLYQVWFLGLHSLVGSKRPYWGMQAGHEL